MKFKEKFTLEFMREFPKGLQETFLMEAPEELSMKVMKLLPIELLEEFPMRF